MKKNLFKLFVAILVLIVTVLGVSTLCMAVNYKDIIDSEKAYEEESELLFLEIQQLFKQYKTAEIDNPEITNVILLIGDGMGFNHLEWAKKEYNIDNLYMETLPYHNNCTTYSYNNAVTDSAASGTALATGIKTNNDQVCKRGEAKLTNITTFANLYGKKTAVITTDDPYGATPSAFSSYSGNRKHYDNLLSRQFESNIDLIVSGVVSGNRVNDDLDIIQQNGYTYLNSTEGLTAFPEGKTYCVFDNLQSDYGCPENNFELKNIASMAIDKLNTEQTDGFFMMIEGARIDKYSHNNVKEGMLAELLAFDATVEYCVEWAKNDGHTAVIVTADHETGGITATENGYKFTKTSHSSANVPLFTYNLPLEDKQYDNTDIFKLCYLIVSK